MKLIPSSERTRVVSRHGGKGQTVSFQRTLEALWDSEVALRGEGKPAALWATGGRQPAGVIDLTILVTQDTGPLRSSWAQMLRAHLCPSFLLSPFWLLHDTPCGHILGMSTCRSHSQRQEAPWGEHPC